MHNDLPETETALDTINHAIELARLDLIRAQRHVMMLERMWNRMRNNDGMIPAESFVPTPEPQQPRPQRARREQKKRVIVRENA